MRKRVFLIVLDSFGIGGAKDEKAFGDEGSNTYESVRSSDKYYAPNLEKLGLTEIVGVKGNVSPVGSYARVNEKSAGKDTTIGHWEIAGVITNKPFPTYPNGFPPCVINEFTKRTGRKVLCNKPYSGTKVILDYGREHIKTGDLIVYTSADSVFQIACHTDVASSETLYEYCKIAREILVGDNAVARVIARPFTGEYPNYVRTNDRRDFSLKPPKTMLNILKDNGLDVIAVGKIEDIFCGSGITKALHTKGNGEGIDVILKMLKEDFNGLCFVNLVDFDMLYGHRNDVDGYAKAISEFDLALPKIMDLLKEDDLLMITADHGCDPKTPSTDHSRENVPLLIYGKKVKSVNLGELGTYSDISASILDYFGLKNTLCGESFIEKIEEK